MKERRHGPTQCISAVADIDDDKCGRNTPVITISPSVTVFRLNTQGNSIHLQAKKIGSEVILYHIGRIYKYLLTLC